MMLNNARPGLLGGLQGRKQQGRLKGSSAATLALCHPLAMKSVLEMLLEVFHHTARQSGVHFAGAVDAADARKEHGFASFRRASTGFGRLGRANDGVGGSGD